MSAYWDFQKWMWSRTPIGAPFLINRFYNDYLKGATLENNKLSRWLYEDNWSKEKLRQYQLLNAVPGVSQYMDYLLDLRADQEYLDRYGMSYSDIHDPRKLRSTSSGSRLAGSAVNMVSRNLDDLYR